MYDSQVYLYCASDPIIESSQRLTFGPYNLSYPHLDEHMVGAKLDPNSNRWDLVFDFTETDADGNKLENF